MKTTRWLRWSLPVAVAALLFSGCGSPSDPIVPPDETPQEIYDVVSHTATRGFPRDIDVADGKLYVAEGSSGVGVYDISNPASLTLIDRNQRENEVRLVKALPGINALFINLTNRTEVLFLDSLKFAPGSQLGSFQANAMLAKVVFDTATSQNLLTPVEYMKDMARVIIADESGGDGLQVYTVFQDSSDIIPGQEYTLFDHEANAVFEYPTDESGLTWIGDTDTVATGLLDYGVAFTDLSKPTWEAGGMGLSDVDTPGEATNLLYNDGYVYVADGVAGLTVIDISDIMAPEVIASWKLDGLDHAVNVAIRGTTLALVDEFDGVYFLDISVPSAPEFLGDFEVRSPTDAIFLDDEMVVISSEGEGITIIRLTLPVGN